MHLTVLLLPRQNQQDTKRLKTALQTALRDIPHRIISDLSQCALPCKLLVAVSLGDDGVSMALTKLLSQLRLHQTMLKGCIGGMVVESNSDFYGKSVATDLAFSLSNAGCALVGAPLVELTGTMKHFPPDNTPKFEVDLSDLLDPKSDPLAPMINSVTLLARRITGPGFRGKSPLTGRPNLPKLLSVHSSLDEETNAMDLWGEMKDRLTPFMTCIELSLRNQSVSRCRNCAFSHCKHFRPSGTCFYGSTVPQEIISALIEADALLLICSNYHNGLHPQQLAFIHTLSDLFPRDFFYEKALYALIVSPYSGGDQVAGQILSNLCLENTFYLPPKFAFLQTASLPMEAIATPDIEDRMDLFSHNILETLSLGHFF